MVDTFNKTRRKKIRNSSASKRYGRGSAHYRSARSRERRALCVAIPAIFAIPLLLFVLKLCDAAKEKNAAPDPNASVAVDESETRYEPQTVEKNAFSLDGPKIDASEEDFIEARADSVRDAPKEDVASGASNDGEKDADLEKKESDAAKSAADAEKNEPTAPKDNAAPEAKEAEASKDNAAPGAKEAEASKDNAAPEAKEAEAPKDNAASEAKEAEAPKDNADAAENDDVEELYVPSAENPGFSAEPENPGFDAED